MPCIFCLAVFALFAGAITTVVLDQMEARLASVATTPVTRTVDSASVATYQTSVAVPGTRGRSVPVNVTVYKKHRRIRIQVMTHDVTRAEAEAIENLLAHVLELTIVTQSDAHDEQKVREAFGEDEFEAELTAPEKTLDQQAPATGRRVQAGRTTGTAATPRAAEADVRHQAVAGEAGA